MKSDQGMSGKGARVVGLMAVVAAASLATGCTDKFTNKIAEQDRTIQRLREENQYFEAQVNALEADTGILNGTIESERQHAEQLRKELEEARRVQASAAVSTGSGAGNGLEGQRSQIARDLDGTGASVGVRDGRLVVSLPSPITFGSGSADLSSNGRETLKKIGRILTDRYGTRTVSIEGHTDNVPIKKSKFGDNWRLSVERAMSVRSYLEKQCALSADRLRVVGYGQHRPLDSNRSDAGRTRNRRVELVIMES